MRTFCCALVANYDLVGDCFFFVVVRGARVSFEVV